jgi:hypothetical protein
MLFSSSLNATSFDRQGLNYVMVRHPSWKVKKPFKAPPESGRLDAHKSHNLMLTVVFPISLVPRTHFLGSPFPVHFTQSSCHRRATIIFFQGLSSTKYQACREASERREFEAPRALLPIHEIKIQCFFGHVYPTDIP